MLGSAEEGPLKALRVASWRGAVLSLVVTLLPVREGAAQVPEAPQSESDAADSSAIAPAPTEPSAAEPPADDASDEAWVLFEDALAQRANGHRGRALALLGQLRLEHPSHPAAARAEQLIRDIEAAAEARRADEAAGIREQDSTLARAEFVTMQSVLGTTYGVVPCVIGGCESPRPWVLASLGGVGLGLGFSLIYSLDGITHGESYTMNASAIWGLAFGYLFTGAFGRLFDDDREYYYDDRFTTGDGVALGMMFGQLGGLGIGALLNARLHPTAGEASLSASMGAWSTGVLAILAIAISRERRPESWARGFHVGAILTAAGGLAIGGYLGHRHDFTRGRVLLMDLGAGIGGGLATALAFLFRGNNATWRGLMAGGAAGIVTGYALAAYLTRNMRFTSEADVSVSVAPTRGGGVVGLSGSF